MYCCIVGVWHVAVNKRRGNNMCVIDIWSCSCTILCLTVKTLRRAENTAKIGEVSCLKKTRLEKLITDNYTVAKCDKPILEQVENLKLIKENMKISEIGFTFSKINIFWK